MIILYYLLYKLVDYPQLWVVKVDIAKEELLEHIYKFESHQEKYYIIERCLNNDTGKSDLEYVDELLKRKPFVRFIPTKEDYIINESKLIAKNLNRYSKFKSINKYDKYSKEKKTSFNN